MGNWAARIVAAVQTGGSGSLGATAGEVFMPAVVVSLDPLAISLYDMVVDDQVHADPALLTSIPPAVFDEADAELNALGASKAATLIRRLKDYHQMAVLKPGDTVIVKEDSGDLFILGKVAMEL